MTFDPKRLGLFWIFLKISKSLSALVFNVSMTNRRQSKELNWKCKQVEGQLLNLKRKRWRVKVYLTIIRWERAECSHKCSVASLFLKWPNDLQDARPTFVEHFIITVLRRCNHTTIWVLKVRWGEVRQLIYTSLSVLETLNELLRLHSVLMGHFWEALICHTSVTLAANNCSHLTKPNN